MKKTIVLSLPERILAARVALRLTKAQVADAAEIDRTYYARVEDGQVKNPSWHTMKSLAKVLGLSLDEMPNVVKQ